MTGIEFIASPGEGEEGKARFKVTYNKEAWRLLYLACLPP